MNETLIHELVTLQHQYFLTNATLNIDFRIHALKKLQAVILKNEIQIQQAIQKDLGKSGFESYMCETGLVLSEISYMLKHIRKYSREKRVPTPLAQFHSRSYKKHRVHLFSPFF